MKKTKVVITDKALKDIPEEDREAVVKDIREMFENTDPEDLPGKVVATLPKGQRTCPNCNGPLDLGPTLDLPDRVVQIYECDPCDEGFEGEPVN